MIGSIIRTDLTLQVKAVPKTIQNKRLALVGMAQGIGGTALGAVVLIAVYIGSRRFVLGLFAKELLEDPSAPFVNFLLEMASRATVEVLLVIALIIIVANVAVFLLAIKRYVTLTPDEAHT